MDLDNAQVLRGSDAGDVVHTDGVSDRGVVVVQLGLRQRRVAVEAEGDALAAGVVIVRRGDLTRARAPQENSVMPSTTQSVKH